MWCEGKLEEKRVWSCYQLKSHELMGLSDVGAQPLTLWTQAFESVILLIFVKQTEELM